MEIEERIDLLEFQVELLFNNSAVDRLIYESKITRKQYKSIMDIMDCMRDCIANGKKVNHCNFELRIYECVPQLNGDYHF